MSVQERLYTAAEFWQMTKAGYFAEDKLYELVDGVILEMNPPNRINAWIALEIGYYFRDFVKDKDLGFVLGADGGYTLAPGTVRVPDVSFVSKARQPFLGQVEDIFAPDLAVEVISPSEKPLDVHDKTALYLNAGSAVVWNVYPDERVIEVWQKGDAGALVMRKYTADDTLDGGAALPGFTLKVRDVFPEWAYSA